MKACDCADCLKLRSPKVGNKVSIKPDKLISKKGILPPDFSGNKNGKFEVVLTADTSTGKPSVALKMPEGIGNAIKIDGKQVWAWYLYNDDLVIEKEEEPTPATFKGGDIVTTNDRVDFKPAVTTERIQKGFRVLGTTESKEEVIIELTVNEGGYVIAGYGLCWKIPVAKVKMVQEYQIKVGDYVRTKPQHRSTLSRELTNNEHARGFKVLAVEGNGLIVELPDNKGYGLRKWTSVNTLPLEEAELAPAIFAKVKDYVRVQKNYRYTLSTRLTDKQKKQAFEIIEIKGNVGVEEYMVKLPDGTSAAFLRNRLMDPHSQENNKVSNGKFSKGMKVKVQADWHTELPDSLNKKAKSQSFEILHVDDEEDQILLKMPKDCEDASFEDEYNCRVWYIDASCLEEPMSAGAAKRGTVMERMAKNAEKGAVKAVGRKLTKATKAGILRALDAAARSHGMDEGQVAAGVKMFTAFMETEFGGALISSLLGLGLAHGAPHIPLPIFQDERLQDLADEMSSEGVAVVMEKLVDIAMTYIAPGIGEVLQGLPPKKEVKEVAVKRVRVASATETKATKRKARVAEETEESEEEEEQATSKRAKAA